MPLKVFETTGWMNLVEHEVHNKDILIALNSIESFTLVILHSIILIFSCQKSTIPWIQFSKQVLAIHCQLNYRYSLDSLVEARSIRHRRQYNSFKSRRDQFSFRILHKTCIEINIYNYQKPSLLLVNEALLKSIERNLLESVPLYESIVHAIGCIGSTPEGLQALISQGSLIKTLIENGSERDLVFMQAMSSLISAQ